MKDGIWSGVGLVALAGMLAMAGRAEAQWDLLTVSDTNTLMRVDLSSGPNYTATSIGLTQDSGGGPVRRVRGLAFAQGTLYGMTREGDLVTVNPNTGETAFKMSVATTGFQWWSDLAYDAVNDDLYTVNAWGSTALVRIDLGTMTSTVQGATTWVGDGSTRQMLGVEFMGGMLVASNRQHQNLVEMDPTDGSFDWTWGNTALTVTNNQQIAVHPGTGVLWGIHDHAPTNNNAVLSTFDASFQATIMGELPFGIVEDLPLGMGTYGWGGIEFVPVPGPGGLCLLAACALGTRRRR